MADYVPALKAYVYVSESDLKWADTEEKLDALIRAKAEQAAFALRDSIEDRRRAE